MENIVQEVQKKNSHKAQKETFDKDNADDNSRENTEYKEGTVHCVRTSSYTHTKRIANSPIKRNTAALRLFK